VKWDVDMCRLPASPWRLLVVVVVVVVVVIVVVVAIFVASACGAPLYRYVWSGANKWNHADTDAFGQLPLWEMMDVGRMYIYDSTMTRLQSSGQVRRTSPVCLCVRV
jgi:hypothetical protein